MALEKVRQLARRNARAFVDHVDDGRALAIGAPHEDVDGRGGRGFLDRIGDHVLEALAQPPRVRRHANVAALLHGDLDGMLRAGAACRAAC